MPIERWGALSVRDHLDTQALIADVLLYDRLVFPIVSGSGERTRWRQENWDPDLQESLIEEFGTDIAVKAEWNEERRLAYNDLRRARKQLAKDAYQATAATLVRDEKLRPPGIDVRVIAAYHDEEEGRHDLGLTTAQPDEIALGKLAFVIGQRLLMPLIDGQANPRDLVLRARDLSCEPAYRARRQQLYLWQVVGWVERKLNPSSAVVQDGFRDAQPILQIPEVALVCV